MCQNHLVSISVEPFHSNFRLCSHKSLATINKKSAEIGTVNRTMSSSDVISKRDIEMLTEQVLIDRRAILTQLHESHQEIDVALLPENVRTDYQKKLELVNGSHETDTADNDGELITLDDFEMYFNRLDRIDKALQSSAQDAKPAPIANSAPAVRKPNETMRRMGSINDMSRLVYKTSSLMNLTTKTFAEPRLPPPYSLKGPATNKTLNAPKTAEVDTRNYHVSADMLAQFNALKAQIQDQLADVDIVDDVAAVQFEGFRRKLIASTDRLQQFFRKMTVMKAFTDSTEKMGNDPLQCLDEDILQRLRNLAEVSSI